MTSERLQNKPSSDKECTCPTVPDDKGNPIKVPTFDTVCKSCRGVDEYAPGTVLEDNEEDRWKVEEDGSVSLPTDPHAYFQSVSELDKHFGPLKVVEEPLPPFDESSKESRALHFPGGYLRDDPQDGYVTKDSGERQVYSTGMQRDVSTDKPRFDLLIPENVSYEHQVLTRFANLMMRGAQKYDPRNWEKANTDTELRRFKESANRHFMQWMMGETDEDHMAAVFFNLMAYETTAWKMAHYE